MKIFELDQARIRRVAGDAASGALGADLVRRAVKTSVKDFMAAKGAAAFKQRMAKGAVPGISLVLGLVFAYNRYKEHPQDYIGIGLELASGVAGLGSMLAVLPVQLARDAYNGVVKDIKAAIAAQGGQTDRPEMLTLSGYPERDLVSHTALTTEILGVIRDQIHLEIKEAQASFAKANTAAQAQAQVRADAISPEAGAAQAARAAATQRMNRSANKPPPQ